jgi:YD repeat-containing protein
MQMPLSMLTGSPFPNYLIPGLILCIVLGLGAFFVLACLLALPNWGWAQRLNPVKDQHWTWSASAAFGLALMIWITVQVLMVGLGALLSGLAQDGSYKKTYNYDPSGQRKSVTSTQDGKTTKTLYFYGPLGRLEKTVTVDLDPKAGGDVLMLAGTVSQDKNRYFLAPEKGGKIELAGCPPEISAVLKAKVGKATELIEYQEGAVVSREVMKRKTGTVTLFAFDKGQGLSEHTAPFDALVYVLEGQVEISISGQPQVLNGGDMIIMPANQPHALKALQPFKMVLTMIRQ